MQSLKKRLSIWVLAVALTLMSPVVAMQFSDEVAWTLSDFIIAGVLLFGAALAYELISRKMNNFAYRAAVGLAGATTVLLAWINGAVGIIGDGPMNMLYAGVVAVGIIGASIARLKPQGMMRALFATAAAQFLVPVIALIVMKPDFSPGVVHVFILNGVFVALWIGSAFLFRRAADKTPARSDF
jgi:hypothetical protein